jgi:hypothetical protein
MNNGRGRLNVQSIARDAATRSGSEIIGRPWFVPTLVVGLVALHRILILGTSLGHDDAFITYRFAEMNASGHFFHWNIAEPPVYGTTTFLFTILLTVFGLIGLPIATVSVLLGGAFHAAAAYFAWRLVERWSGAKAGLMAAVLVASDGFGVWATVGMETYLYIVLLFAGLWFYETERLSWSAAACAALMLTRIDGALLSALLFLHFLLSKRKLVWKPLLVYALVLLPWVAVTLAMFGTVLPNSLAAKQAHRMIGTSGAYAISQFKAHLGLLPLIILCAAAVWGWLRQIKNWKTHTTVVLGVFAVLNAVLYSRAQLPNFQWYYAPPIAALWLLAGSGLFVRPSVVAAQQSAASAGKVTGKKGGKRKAAMKAPPPKVNAIPQWASWAAALVLCAVSLSISWKFFARDPLASGWHRSPQVEAAHYLQQHAKPGLSVLAAEVGSIGYYNPRLAVQDLMGLVSPRFIEPLKALAFVEAAAQANPDYIFLVDKVGYKVTESIFHPDIWYSRFGSALQQRDPNWLQRYGGFYKDNYEVVEKWPYGTYPDGRTVYYVLAARKRA